MSDFDILITGARCEACGAEISPLEIWWGGFKPTLMPIQTTRGSWPMAARSHGLYASLRGAGVRQAWFEHRPLGELCGRVLIATSPLAAEEDPDTTTLRDLMGRAAGMTMKGPACRVFWGSHGCERVRGHDGPHLCLSCFDADDQEGWVGAPPYYGPETVFYGEDVPAGHPPPPRPKDPLPLMCACGWEGFGRCPRPWWRHL